MKILPALPFTSHSVHGGSGEGAKIHRDIKTLYPTATHALGVEIVKPSPDALDPEQLKRTLLQRVQDAFREARIPVHGIVPFHQGHDAATGTSFVRAYITFPTPAQAHQGALTLQQHVDAQLPTGTIKALPRAVHSQESTPGERFHPHLLTV